LVKLFGPGQSNFSFRHEKAKILATIDGFGEYEHEARRAVRLLAALETIRTPDIVVRPSQKLKNGDRAFVKEFNDATYPYMVVIVHRENSGLLALTTAVPTRHRNLKDWIVGEQLFPKTPQPSPQGMAV
jgi:hypothetical protein